MSRKTVKITALIETVNKRNRNSTCGKEAREGWNSLLELVLMDTGNYHGFEYLTEKDVPKGLRPGRNSHKPVNKMGPDEVFEGCDSTRIAFIKG